ncbi:hypothetical protein [Flavobacterium sp.]|jgi:hypothetical protein|uniref:hypothetical protein n=1 Tax=Flavobacterium sp. TaxID=239 RepID=UPI0037C0C42E
MAFKSKALENIGQVGSPSQALPTISNGTTATVIGLSIANTSAAPIYGTAKLNKADGSKGSLIKDGVIVPGGTLIVVGGDQKVVAEAGDTITCYSSAANSADIVCSYLLE